jgi:hypothetical protein
MYTVSILLQVRPEMDRDILNYANEWKLPKAEAAHAEL